LVVGPGLHTCGSVDDSVYSGPDAGFRWCGVRQSMD